MLFTTYDKRRKMKRKLMESKMKTYILKVEFNKMKNILLLSHLSMRANIVPMETDIDQYQNAINAQSPSNLSVYTDLVRMKTNPVRINNDNIFDDLALESSQSFEIGNGDSHFSEEKLGKI